GLVDEKILHGVEPDGAKPNERADPLSRLGEGSTLGVEPRDQWGGEAALPAEPGAGAARGPTDRFRKLRGRRTPVEPLPRAERRDLVTARHPLRSEERRVGKEG